MNDKSLCRIGVFYDGSYFSYAQAHFYYDRKLGWMVFPPFHIMIENFLREKEQGYSNYRVVYAGWFQGLFHSNQSSDQQRRLDRNRHIDLMHAGIDPKYVPMSQAQGEKGVDISLALDALQVGLDDKIDIAVLVTGDGDFVPLARALMKNGVRVATVYFEYETEKDKAFANERLLSVSNYVLNVNELEKDRKNQSMFRGLFRQPEKDHEPTKEAVLHP
ncbi:MAG: NYN domain-containing protein [Chloroflexi bacterium UTCFX4]|nr:MAG: NYN domain-containing protein [Chloroflexi bacterium UTCFX4]